MTNSVRLQIGLCLMASCLAAEIFSGGFCAAARAGDLRIVAYNAEILSAPGSRASRLTRYRWETARRQHFERVASIIETLEPDVLTLIEVTSGEAVDLLVDILHEKGLKEYRGYHVESQDGYTGMDVAAISKIEPDRIEGQHIRCMFSAGEDNTWKAEANYTNAQGEPKTIRTSIQRNGLFFITAGKHKLGFLGLHLKSNPDDAYANGMRTAQALVARRIVEREIVARGYLPIVLGDLNDYDPDVPDRDESRSTKTDVLRTIKDFSSARQGDELVNAAKWIVRQQDRYTSHWDRNENRAEDPGDVYTMLDHILLPTEFSPFVRRAFISHDSDLSVSDHWPVVVDLRLPD